MAVKYKDIATDHESIQKLMDQMDEELANSPEPDETEEFVNPTRKRFLFEKFDFSWDREEKAYLTTIKTSAEIVIVDVFSDVMEVIDGLYEQARVIQRRSSGSPVKDENNRLVWERDKFGNYKEDWGSVENKDLENTLVRLYQIKMSVSSKVSDLYLEAVSAKYFYKDGFNLGHSKYKLF